MAKPRPIVSYRTRDGAIIEMVHDEEHATTALLHAHGETLSTHDALVLPSGEKLVPYSPHNNLLTHKVILLPERATEYGSQRKLVDAVRAFIHRYVDVSPSFEAIASFYVLFSWLYDDFNEVPYLRVRGDYGSGKSRFLLTIGSLVYKPIFASGASSVSPLFRLLDSVGGTLLIDEGDFRLSDEKADIIKILNNGNARGFPVLRSEVTPQKEFNPRAFAVFGPKVVATRRLFDDRALESRCLTEDMDGRTVRSDIPLNLPGEFWSEATKLRNQLLLFRFRNLGASRDLSHFWFRGIEPRLSQIIAPLLAITDDATTREELLALSRNQHATLAGDRQLSVEADVLSCIARLVAVTPTPALKDIAALFSTRFPDYAEVSPRWIGGILRKRLGLAPMKSNGVFVIARRDLPRVHMLLKKYGVDRGDNRDESTAPAPSAARTNHER